MRLPELHAKRIPNGDPFPVLICLPNGAAIAAIADTGPDYDPEDVAEEIVRAVRAWGNLRRYYLDPVSLPLEKQ